MAQEKTRTEEIIELRAEMNRSYTEISERIDELESILKRNLELYDNLSKDYFVRIDKNLIISEIK
jgi:phosphate uptake regulator